MSDDKYPQLVQSRGKIIKSINHFCNLKKIVALRRQIGADAYTDIEENSQLGIFLKFAGTGFVWASKPVIQLLGNTLETRRASELWVLADGRPIRLSLHEFESITQLNCGLPEKAGNLVVGELWGQMGLEHGDGPNWAELEGVLDQCKEWPVASRKMLGLLVIMFVCVFGLHPNSRLPVYHAKLVMDPARFERHPWGREAFSAIVRSIPRSALGGQTYTLHGCVHVLLVWAYEHIPKLGEMFGRRMQGEEIPLLRWRSTIPRCVSSLEDVFLADKNLSLDNQVRVVHLIPKPVEEIDPVWPGEDVEDIRLERMIRDILDDKLDESFWISQVAKRKADDQVPASAIVKKKKPKVPKVPAASLHKEAEPENEPEQENEPQPAKVNDKPAKVNEGGRSIVELVHQSLDRISRLEDGVRNNHDNLQDRIVRLEEKSGDAEMVGERVSRLEDKSDKQAAEMNERIALLEEKAVDQAVINERLRRLEDKVLDDSERFRRIEDSMARQEVISARLAKFLDSFDGQQPSRPYMLADGKKSGTSQRSENQEGNNGDNLTSRASESRASEVTPPSKKGVRKTVLDYDID